MFNISNPHPSQCQASTNHNTRVWRCPNCGGRGSMMDGSVQIGPNDIVITKPSSVCWLCRGKRKVRVMPIEDDECTK